MSRVGLLDTMKYGYKLWVSVEDSLLEKLKEEVCIML